MIPLYTQKEFDNTKYTDKLRLECEYCHEPFYKTKTTIKFALTHIGNNKRDRCNYCSHKCSNASRDTKVKCKCHFCNKVILRRKTQLDKYTHFFCSNSCGTKYQNAHGTKSGSKISKLEKYLQEQLPILYPSLEFHFNRKDTIKAELDIYIPSLKLAFELNGPVHYEPIFGPDTLKRMQSNDQRKFGACIEHGISLCVIDTSQHKYIKPHTCQKYLDIITDIINPLV